jgi:hypothetical protein
VYIWILLCFDLFDFVFLLCCKHVMTVYEKIMIKRDVCVCVVFLFMSLNCKNQKDKKN